MKAIKSYLYSIGMILGLSWIIWCNSGCLGRTTYVEGTSVSVGAYIPNDGNIYGLQLVNYISGIKISASTNANLSVTRNSTLNSNFLFGLAHTVETNATRISITKDSKTDDIKQ